MDSARAVRASLFTSFYSAPKKAVNGGSNCYSLNGMVGDGRQAGGGRDEDGVPSRVNGGSNLDSLKVLRAPSATELDYFVSVSEGSKH